MTSSTDRIEKKVVLSAPRARVWRAITDVEEFGTWFGMRLGAPFRPATTVHGTIVPTKVDAEVAAMQRPHEGLSFQLRSEALEPETLFSFRWHPFAVDPSVDFSKEETTLVAFRLEHAPGGGTLLTITESGFDRIPLERKAKAFAANDGGWTKQCELIAKYLDRGAP